MQPVGQTGPVESAVVMVKRGSIPEPPTDPPIDVPPLPDVMCGWCHHVGTPIIEIEFVRTGGGERRRCTDRDACRSRVDVARRAADALGGIGMR